MRRIEVEFGVKISDVAPAELGPLLESLTRLAKNGTVSVSPETQRILRAVAPAMPLALTARSGGGLRPSRWKFTEAKVTAALTAWQGNMAKAAKALGASPAGLYQFCHKHRIAPERFRVPKRLAAVRIVRLRGRPSLLSASLVSASLIQHAGNVKTVAHELAVSAITLYHFCKRHSIVPAAYRVNAAVVSP